MLRLVTLLFLWRNRLPKRSVPTLRPCVASKFVPEMYCIAEIAEEEYVPSAAELFGEEDDYDDNAEVSSALDGLIRTVESQTTIAKDVLDSRVSEIVKSTPTVVEPPEEPPTIKLVTSETTSWSCKVCSFENDKYKAKCTVCRKGRRPCGLVKKSCRSWLKKLYT